MQAPVRTIYDNDETMLYKWAAYLDTPARYIVIVDGKYRSLISYAHELAEYPLITIFERVSSPDIYPFPNIRLETDIANIMGRYYLDSGVNEEEVIDTINNYYRELGLGTSIVNAEDLFNSIETWGQNKERYLRETLERYYRIEELERRLSELPAQYAGELTVTSIVIVTTPRTRILDNEGRETVGPIPRPEEALDIWNQSVLSHELPFLRYSGREDLSKIYLSDLPHNLNLIVTPNIYGEEVIVGTVLLPERLTKVTAHTYTGLIYRLQDQTLTVSIPDTSDPQIIDRVLDRIEQHTPLILTDPREARIGGEFNVYGFTYNDALLLDVILNQELFRAYLYVDESVNPVATKGKIVVQYRAFEKGERNSSAKATLSRGITTVTEKLRLYNEEDELADFEVSVGTPYLKVTITYADNREVALRFLTIFRRLLSFYKDVEAERGEFYQLQLERPFAPITLEIPGTPEIPQANTIDGLTFDLPRAAPHIFVKNYSKFCQGSYKPAIISPDRIEEWRSGEFTKGGRVYQRQVLPYPKDNPEIYLVCPSERSPFPGVKANAKLENRERYPYIPCCYEDDQTGKVGSDYNRFYLDNALRGRERTRHHKIVTNKVLEPGRLGSLSKSIISVLRQDPYLSQALDNGTELSRYGVDIGPNSFIHCVAIAVGDPEYLDAEDKEEYVKSLRTQLIGFYPGLVKQELYDSTDEEIRAKIADVDSFFDPSLFYRLLEEAYDVNIYVFYPPPNKESTPGGIELPRHRLFHARAPRARNTVLIVKHKGGGADALDQPQCELVVYGEKYRIDGTIFTPEMGAILHKAIIDMNKVLTWTPEPNGLQNLPNLYSINYEELYPNPVSQFIDPYGKLRALTIPLGDGLVTVAIPPTQPLNLPIIDKPYRIDRQIVIDAYGPPSKDEGGLWYPGDIYFYTTQGGVDPLFSSTSVGRVSRFRLLKRLLRILLQYILWTFQLSNLSVDGYFDSWIYAGNTQEDNLGLYDISRVKRILPRVTSTQEAIDYISRTVPGMVKRNKIFLPDRKTAEGVRYYLSQYLGNTRPDQRKPITTIEGLYEANSDFIQQQGVAVFLNDRELRKWMASVEAERARITVIKTELLLDYAGIRQPYLYKTPDNLVYLVQNVSKNSKRQAIQVGMDWKVAKVNPGFDSPEFPGKEPSYILYRISTSNGLAVVEDKSNGSNDFIEILDYGGKYAALLRLPNPS